MTLLVGVSLNIGSHAWYVRQVLAERQAAAQAGVRIEVRDAEDSVDRQIAQVHELIDLGAQALLLSATRADAIGEALDECLRRGVAVIGESIALDHEAVVSEVRVDDVTAGIPLGVAAASATVVPDDRPLRVTSVGFSSLRESHDRERGFLEGLRRTHRHVQVAFVDGRAQVQTARIETRAMIESLGPDWRMAPEVLFGVDDESIIGARAAYGELGVGLASTVVATYGISPPSGPALLDDGTITLGAAMFPEWHGRTLFDLAMAHLQGRDHERLVLPPSAVVTAAGTATGWDRFYRRRGDEYELDMESVRALA